MKLALFFTRNVSLREWVDRGLFDREKLLYEEHLRRGTLEAVTWLTYGAEDGALAARLKTEGRLAAGITVLPMPPAFRGRLGRWRYSFRMHRVHREALRSADVLKTNQMDGSWSAARAKRMYEKPLLVRTGFTATAVAAAGVTPLFRRTLYPRAERLAYRAADAVAVPTDEDRERICRQYRLPAAKVHILPNYVDTRRFRPGTGPRDENALVFVGRLTPVKNLPALLAVAGGLRRPLIVYGEGELRGMLERAADAAGATIQWKGVCPNAGLPDELNRFRFFVLPSLYEGMPKALLEAMACGLVCIATDRGGPAAILNDGVNGYLARGTGPEALSAAIRRAEKGPRDEIAAAAVETVRARFSLDAVATREAEILKTLVKR